VRPDHWTVVTADRKLCAHFEHTICISGGPAEILTEFPATVYQRIGGRVRGPAASPVAVALGSAG
jgi:hypothetical protein